MNSPSADVKDILIGYDSSSSSPYEFGTNLFVSFEPDTPDRCLTILDSGGYDPEIEANYEKPTIQIRSRDVPGQYRRAYGSLRTVVDLLHGSRVTVNTTVYVFWQQGDIIHLGKDEKNRDTLTANMRIHRTPA
jgi:hypothetical protein